MSRKAWCSIMFRAPIELAAEFDELSLVLGMTKTACYTEAMSDWVDKVTKNIESESADAAAPNTKEEN